MIRMGLDAASHSHRGAGRGGLAVAFLLGGGITFLAVGAVLVPDNAKVTITAPGDRSEVGPRETVRGTSSRLRSDQDIWVLVQPSAVPMFHPQVRPAARLTTGGWSIAAFFASGAPRPESEEFRLVAAVASPAASRALSDYLERSARENLFPGLTSLPEGMEIKSEVKVFLPGSGGERPRTPNPIRVLRALRRAIGGVAGQAIAAVIGGLILYWLIVDGNPPPPPPVTVPALAGRPLAEASEALESAGLRIAEDSRLCRDQAQGRVVDQEPEGGSTVKRGAGVSLAVSEQKPEGEILSPRSGDREVPRSYTVEGTVCGIPRGRHLWLAVETGAGLYPKTREVVLSAKHRFATDVIEAGSPQHFSLVLLLVGSRGHREIERWLRRGEETGRFPPLESITGSTRLDVVSGLAPASE